MKLTKKQKLIRYMASANGAFVTTRRASKTLGISYTVVGKLMTELIDEGIAYKARVWSSDGNMGYGLTRDLGGE